MYEDSGILDNNFFNLFNFDSATGFEYKNISKSVWNFLVVNDEPKPADVIIVLSSGTDRVEEGVTFTSWAMRIKSCFPGKGLRIWQPRLNL